jgi:hypothetical protein
MNPIPSPHLRSYTCDKKDIFECVVFESSHGWKLHRKVDMDNDKVMLVFKKFKAVLIAEAKEELEKDFAVLDHKLIFPMDSDTD